MNTVAAREIVKDRGSLLSQWAQWWPRTAQERLSYSLALAAIAHAVVIFGITFVRPQSTPTTKAALDVTLVSYHDERTTPPDFLAQREQQGSGDEKEARILSSTDTSDLRSDRATDVYEEQNSASTASEQRTDTLRAETIEGAATTAQEANEAGTTRSDRPYLDIAQQIATLQARLDREAQDRAKGPRIRRISSVSTTSTAEAYYLDAWRKQVETVGNLNYPSEAASQHLYGALRLLVTINADGQLKDVQLLESSGYDVLDAAAMRIVRLAAPFAPFPEDMRKQADSIEIVRTWQFRRSRNGAEMRT